MREPALQFWLEYAERRGSATELRGDQALVLLTPELQRALALPEELAVTSDPEVAREDGALLLIPGHPLLDRAVADVLGEGDAGHLYLPWPRSEPPRPEELLAKARDLIGVSHGRIDAAGEPIAAYLPVLRIGALIRYTLGERFQEREEVWVDARSAVELADDTRRALEGLEGSPAGDPDRATLRPDVVAALEGAERALSARAAAREQGLLRIVQGERQSELERARAYYAEVLASIEQRRAGAAPERQALLDAQAGATRAERARRLQEIEDRFAAQHEVTPFRLHLLLVPALHLPLTVRRGERRYPFALGWLLHARAFAPFRCPHCGAMAPLVAGRDHLGCEICLPPAPVSVTAEPEPEAHAQVAAPIAPPKSGRQRVAPTMATRRGSPTTQPPAKPARRTPAAPRPPRPRTVPEPSGPEPDGAWIEGLAEYREMRERVRQAGETLARQFWSAVAARTTWPSAATEPDSPLAVLCDIYGPGGPLVALGGAPGRVPLKVSSWTAEPDPQGRTATDGRLFFGQRDHGGLPFTLRWQLRDGTAVVSEVLPFPEVTGDTLPPLASLPAAVASRLSVRVPPPRAVLEGIAAEVWQTVVPVDGLPLALRCLSAWRLARGARQQNLLHNHADRLHAVASADEMARRAGLKRTRAAAAAAYGVDPADLAAAVGEIRALWRRADRP